MASAEDRSAQIARHIQDAIMAGQLHFDTRLPSEAELADQFECSRSTVREALKRLAARSLIRTERGAFGGAFVRRLSYEEAYGEHVTTSTLLLSMNDVSFEVACEARFALERACAPLACLRRTDAHLARMAQELAKQGDPALSDEAFCTSDVAFHRAFVDATGNAVMAYQLAGAVEAMQPLMNMITFTARSRDRILALHHGVLDGLRSRDERMVLAQLEDLATYTASIGQDVVAARARR